MQLQTHRHPTQRLSTLQGCTRKQPPRRKAFPVACETPRASGNQARILASFRLAERTPIVAMDYERQGDAPLVEPSTDGSMRGLVTAKAIVARLTA